MPLPSSNPRDRVTAALSNPQINLANYTPNPSAVLGSLSQGVQVGQQLGDALVLRPKQIEAARAQSDAATQAALTSQDASKAQRQLIPLQTTAETGLIPLRAKAATSDLQNQDQNNQTSLILGAVKHGVATDPAFAELFKKQIVNSQATATAQTGREAVLAQGAEKTAPQEAQTNALNTSTANAQADVTNSLANTDAVKEAQFQTGINNATTAAGTSAVQAAPFSNPAVLDTLKEGAQAGAVNQGLTQKIQLGNTIATGVGGGTQLSPDAQAKVIEAAAAKGVQIAGRSFADISHDYNQRVNVENASKVLDSVRTDSTNAQNKLQTYGAIQQILPATATGGLRSLPGADIIDSVAAGWGNRSSQANQQLQSFQNSLVLDATGGHLGNSISDGDTAILKSSYPGPKQSAVVNQQLTTAGILVNQRLVQKNDFYNDLVPSMGAAGADKLWNQYVSTNPLFDPSKSSTGSIQFNRNALTPTEYLQAVQNPSAAVQTLSQKVDPSTVPQFNPRNPSNAPFVQSGDSIIPNPVFWTPIQAANKQFAQPASANTNTAQRIQNVVTTPIADLLRPRKP